MSSQLEKEISEIREHDNLGFSPEDKAKVFEYITSRIESGMSLFDAVKNPFDTTKNVVSIKNFHSWINDNLSWGNEYSRVCSVRHDVLAEQTLKIADSQLIATKVVETEKGIYTTTYDNVERSKLMVHARQWFVGKVASEKYGAKAGEGTETHVEQPLFNDIG